MRKIKPLKQGSANIGELADIRTLEIADYIISSGATVRGAAKCFGISKSTVHKDITTRLKRLCPQKHIAVAEILEKNKSERHFRGGKATKEKYFLKSIKNKKRK